MLLDQLLLPHLLLIWFLQTLPYLRTCSPCWVRARSRYHSPAKGGEGRARLMSLIQPLDGGEVAGRRAPRPLTGSVGVRHTVLGAADLYARPGVF